MHYRSILSASGSQQFFFLVVSWGWFQRKLSLVAVSEIIITGHISEVTKEIGCLTCVSDSCLCLVHNFALAMVLHLSTKGKHFQLFCVWFESTLTVMFSYSFRFCFVLIQICMCRWSFNHLIKSFEIWMLEIYDTLMMHIVPNTHNKCWPLWSLWWDVVLVSSSFMDEVCVYSVFFNCSDGSSFINSSNCRLFWTCIRWIVVINVMKLL